LRCNPQIIGQKRHGGQDRFKIIQHQQHLPIGQVIQVLLMRVPAQLLAPYGPDSATGGRRRQNCVACSKACASCNTPHSS